MRELAICAGYGGFHLALRILFPTSTLVGAIERQAYAAAILRCAMEESSDMGSLLAIWPDVESFVPTAHTWRDQCDIITAGIPCQPWSVAGLRKGQSDARWIWEPVHDIIDAVQPDYVWLENVPGLVRKGGLSTILGGLNESGYDAVWDCVSASQVGANHERERLWVLAAKRDGRRKPRHGTDSQSLGRRTGLRGDSPGTPTESDNASVNARDATLTAYDSAGLRRSGEATENVPDAESQRLQSDISQESSAIISKSISARKTGDDTDAKRGRREVREPEEREAIRLQPPQRIRRPGDATNPNDVHGSSQRHPGRSHSRRKTEAPTVPGGAGLQVRSSGIEATQEPTATHIGWWDAQPALCRMVNGVTAGVEPTTLDEPARSEQLHALGNGIVPLQAAFAFVVLAKRLGIWEELKGEAYACIR